MTMIMMMVFPMKARRWSMRKGLCRQTCSSPKGEKPQRTTSKGWLKLAMIQGWVPAWRGNKTQRWRDRDRDIEGEPLTMKER